MTLDHGARLGPYEIVSAIGAGGMGEVYRARDARLGRDVTIKILPEAFAADPERLARFEREARALAALNHSNIAQIFGLEDVGTQRALVMELVEGPTLAELLEGLRAKGDAPRGEGRGLPLDEALPIAKQIADALEAAHDQGIVHRDLKPANIKVKADGAVKVLDFGLAKALAPEGASAAWLREGLNVGVSWNEGHWMSDALTLTSDPVIEAYKKDVDRTLIREMLKLTPEERVLKLQDFVTLAIELRKAGRSLPT